MERHHPTSRKKKFKDIPSAWKVMTTVFSDAQGVTSVGIMPRGQINNSNLHIQTFKTSQKHFRRFRSHQNGAQILFQHHNPQGHISLKTQETITKLG
jgi:hypothetical protein